MRDLTNAEAIAHLLSNHTVALGKEGRLDDALAHNNLGLARLNLGDAEGACADWIRALELEPGMREAGENLDRLLRTR